MGYEGMNKGTLNLHLYSSRDRHLSSGNVLTTRWPRQVREVRTVTSIVVESVSCKVADNSEIGLQPIEHDVQRFGHAKKCGNVGYCR